MTKNEFYDAKHDPDNGGYFPQNYADVEQYFRTRKRFTNVAWGADKSVIGGDKTVGTCGM